MTDNAEDLQVTEAGPSTEPENKNKRYRKPKPWDTDDIDHVPLSPITTADLLCLTFVLIT